MSEEAAASTVRIRRGSSADFDAVAALYEAVAAEGTWIGAEAPVTWTPQRRESWRQRADDEEAGAWFLAEEVDGATGVDGALLGYLSLGREYGVRAGFSMAVAEGARGRGVGGLLLDAAIDWCRKAALIKIDCEVWPHNGAALALYRSRGFEVEGRLRRHWRRRNGQLWDTILMGLVLDETSPGSGRPDAELPPG